MFNANDLKIAFSPISTEPQLVIIPVNSEYGVVAVVKPLGGGKAACIAFSPATRLDNPFQGYRPTFLRKLVTTDLPLREGRWKPLSIDAPSTMTLRTAVVSLFKDFDNLSADAIKEIELRRPTNVSSSPEVSGQTYCTPENVPFEKAIGHLVGLEFTMARAIAKRQAELNVAVTPAPVVTSEQAETERTETKTTQVNAAPPQGNEVNPEDVATTIHAEAHAGSQSHQTADENSN